MTYFQLQPTVCQQKSVDKPTGCCLPITKKYTDKFSNQLTNIFEHLAAEETSERDYFHS